MRSLFLKLFFSFFVLTFFFGILFFLISNNIFKKTYIEGLESHLEDLNYVIMPYIKEFIKRGEYDSLRKFMKQKAEKVDIVITVFDSLGNVLADSREEFLSFKNYRYVPEISSALKGKKGVKIRYSERFNEKMFYIALPIIKDQKIIGVLRTGFFLKEMNPLFSGLKKRLFFGIFILLLFSWLLSILISRSFSSPLRRLLKSFKKLSEGDFDVKILTKRKDEMGELILGFDKMVDKIKTLFDDLKRERTKLLSFISSIPDGIMFLDKEGRIIFFNDRLKEFLKEDIEKKEFFFEVIKDPNFGKMFDIAEKKGEIKGEIVIHERTFLCGLRSIAETDEILAIFYDITELKEIKEVKRDIVENISHELKTPITAIKGFIETLEEEEDIKNKRYIEIIKNNIDRVMEIISNMLYLSELESDKIILKREKINLKEIIYDVITIFEKRLRDKDIELELNIQVHEFEADRFKMESMFINLIDNAIKYTEKGKITISSFIEGKNIKIEIRDTGEGIPKEHLSRIFERFYVVDRGRDKERGGAGLGLSIVKHIVLMHNGKIDVQSEPGKGTKFTITIPI